MEKKEQLKKRLLLIYNFYASFGDRKNNKYLKSNVFIKMMTESNIKDNKYLDQKRLDLLFYQHQKKQNLDFQMFLNLLVKISQQKYPELDKRQALDTLINKNLMQLYDKIINNTGIGNEIQKYDRSIDQKVLKLVNYSEQILLKIYEAYFQYETIREIYSHEYLEKNSQQAINTFSKDFDICPSVLNKSQTIILYNFLVNNATIQHDAISSQFKTSGRVFRFWDFINYIILCGISTNNYNQQLSDFQRMYQLMEKMEMSEGFTSFWKKTKMNNNIKQPYLIDYNRIKEDQNISQEIDLMHLQYQQNQMEIVQSEVFKKYQDVLYMLFQQYCSIGENMNINKMGLGNYIKMMKDCQILAQNLKESNCLFSSTSELELIYKKSIIYQNKQTFEQFLLSLQIMASRLSVLNSTDQNSQLQYLIEKKLSLLVKTTQSNKNYSNEYIHILMDLVQDQQVVELLGGLFKGFFNFYKLYANNQQLIDFDRFMKICKDFDVFPDLCGKAKLLRIFSALTQIHSSNNQNQKLDLINANLFIEGMMLVAIQLQQFSLNKNVDNIQKIIYLFERMNHSQGPSKATQLSGQTRGQNMNWDLLVYIRQSFSDYLEDFQQKVDTNLSFDQLI